jgi:hypothetical protein
VDSAPVFGPQLPTDAETAAAVRLAAEIDTHPYVIPQEIAAASEVAAQTLSAWMSALIRAEPEAEPEIGGW